MPPGSNRRDGSERSHNVEVRDGRSIASNLITHFGCSERQKKRRRRNSRKLCCLTAPQFTRRQGTLRKAKKNTFARHFAGSLAPRATGAGGPPRRPDRTSHAQQPLLGPDRPPPLRVGLSDLGPKTQVLPGVPSGLAAARNLTFPLFGDGRGRIVNWNRA